MMRSLLYVAALCMVCFVAIWAYKVIDTTRDLLRDVERLQSRITDEREALSVARAEWAWLNRPERLARLAAEQEETLGLVPMTPLHFGEVATVAFQPPPPHPPGPAPRFAMRPDGDPDAAMILMGRAPAAVGDGEAIAVPTGAEGAPLPASAGEDAPQAAREAAAPQSPPPSGASVRPLDAPQRTEPTPPALAEAEPAVDAFAIAGGDFLALGLTPPPPRPALPPELRQSSSLSPDLAQAPMPERSTP